jgi:hypothetical protein
MKVIKNTARYLHFQLTVLATEIIILIVGVMLLFMGICSIKSFGFVGVVIGLSCIIIALFVMPSRYSVVLDKATGRLLVAKLPLLRESSNKVVTKILFQDIKCIQFVEHSSLREKGRWSISYGIRAVLQSDKSIEIIPPYSSHKSDVRLSASHMSRFLNLPLTTYRETVYSSSQDSYQHYSHHGGYGRRDDHNHHDDDNCHDDCNHHDDGNHVDDRDCSYETD